MKKSPFFCSIFLTVLFLLASCSNSEGESASSNLHAIFLDVGQGDALLLQSADRNILVDVGAHSDLILPKLRQYGVDTLDAIFLSHQDLDHMGAMAGIVGQIPIVKIYLGPDSGGARWDSVAQKLGKLGTFVDTLFRGDELSFGSLHMRVLWPEQNWHVQGNAASMVLRIEHQKSSILATGDLESEQEFQLLDWEADLRTDLLKVGHHGSKSSSSLDFLGAVLPYAAVISVGRSNDYGHPEPSTLANLLSVLRDSSAIYRTDLQGDLHFVLGAQGIVGLP